jgi:hypothetical protein
MSGCYVFERVGNEPKVLHRDSNFISVEGWNGVSVKDNGRVIYEMIDSSLNDGRYDLWRYYSDGRLIKEEKDRNNDDLVDYVVYYGLSDGFLRGVERDDNYDNKYDYVLKHFSFRKWIEKKDLNGDGIYEVKFLFKGPLDLLSKGSRVNPERVSKIKELLPSKHWVNIFFDDNNNGIDDRVVSYVKGREVSRKLNEGKRTLWPFGRNKDK